MKEAFLVPGEHATYPHHFPTKVLVPGYLLLELIMQRLSQLGYTATSVKNCKFLSPVFPAEQGALEIEEIRGSRLSVSLVIGGQTRLRAQIEAGICP